MMRNDLPIIRPKPAVQDPQPVTQWVAMGAILSCLERAEAMAAAAVALPPPCPRCSKPCAVSAYTRDNMPFQSQGPIDFTIRVAECQCSCGFSDWLNTSIKFSPEDGQPPTPDG